MRRTAYSLLLLLIALLTVVVGAALWAAREGLHARAGSVRAWATTGDLAWDVPVTWDRGLLVLRAGTCCWGVEIR